MCRGKMKKTDALRRFFQCPPFRSGTKSPHAGKIPLNPQVVSRQDCGPFAWILKADRRKRATTSSPISKPWLRPETALG